MAKAHLEKQVGLCGHCLPHSLWHRVTKATQGQVELVLGHHRGHLLVLVAQTASHHSGFLTSPDGSQCRRMVYLKREVCPVSASLSCFPSQGDAPLGGSSGPAAGAWEAGGDPRPALLRKFLQ